MSIPRPFHPASLPPGEGEVLLELSGSTAELVLRNPAARNAVSPGMMVQLGEAVTELERWPGVALLVRGADGSFCAGGDLRAVRSDWSSPSAGAAVGAWMAAVLDRLANLPLVVLAAVEGAALGGGAELLTAVDHVVADADATIGFVHASLGVSPGWGGGARLVRRVGARRALHLLAFSERHPADRALQLGVVDEIAPAGSAVKRARERVDRLASMPAQAVRAAVAIARSGDRDEESRRFASLWGGPAHLDALDRVRAGRR